MSCNPVRLQNQSREHMVASSRNMKQRYKIYIMQIARQVIAIMITKKPEQKEEREQEK